jgi:threonine/homoserine/homoserine lactone efflux protein
VENTRNVIRSAASIAVMIATDRLLTFAATAFILIIIPGPSVLFVISRGVTLGRRAALATVAGNTTGVMVQVTAVAIGIGSLVQSSAAVYGTIRFAGAAYLVFLGVRAFRERRRLRSVLDATVVAKRPRTIYLEGFVVGVTNPKAAVFFAAVLPQFADPALGHVPLQILGLGLVFAAIALVSDSAWGLAAGTLRSWLGRSPGRLERLGGAGGLAIVGLGVHLAVTGRRD